MTIAPPEPLLLDTCVLQHLSWVERLIAEAGGRKTWSHQDESKLSDRYGAQMARQLLDLGVLFVELQERDGFPWLVSNSAKAELDAFARPRAVNAHSLFRYFDGHQEDWGVDAYPSVAIGTLRARGPWKPSPLILRGLGVMDVSTIVAADGPLAFLPNLGDRCIARDALLANVPAILTLDVRTFWRHRAALANLGVQIWLPSDLLDAYVRVWQRDRSCDLED